MSYCDIAPEFYDTSEPIARKEHKCCECRAPILKGEKHWKGTGKWEGVLSTYRQHLLCCQACRFIRDMLNDGECICFGDLKEWYAEARCQDDRTHPAWREFRRMMAGILRRERAVNAQGADA